MNFIRALASNPDVSFSWRAVLGELIATMIYVFLSTMAHVLSHPDSGPIENANLISSLGHILALVSVTHTFHPVSGAHVNPAGTNIHRKITPQ